MARVSGDVTHTASLGSFERNAPSPFAWRAPSFVSGASKMLGSSQDPGPLMASLYVLCPCRTRCTTLRPRTKMGNRRWLEARASIAAATSSADAAAVAVRPSLIVLSDRCSELASSCPGDMMYCDPPSSPGESATSSYAEGSMEVSRVGVRRTASGTCAAARGSMVPSSAPRFKPGDVPRSSASSRASLRIRIVFRGSAWWMGTRAKAGSARVRGTARRYPLRARRRGAEIFKMAV